MRPPLLALAVGLLVPCAATAEPLDVAEDAEPPVLDAPVLETDEAAPSDAARLGDLEDQVDGNGPLQLEPKLDLMDDQPESVSGTSPLDHTAPEPAPGVRLTIPTN